MANVVKLLRSTTPGQAPASLVSGQIAINEADGKIFWLDGNGSTILSATLKGLDATAASHSSTLAALGTAATKNVGVAANNVLQLDANAKIPSVDGSQIASLNASALGSGTVPAARGGAGAVSGILKANGAGAVSAATAGTDYLAPPSGAALLKANSGGALANAVQGTDFSLLTAVASVATTSGTAIDFTGIPSGVKRIVLMLSGVSTSGSSPFLVRVGSGGVTTSGYNGSGGTITTSSAIANFTAGWGSGGGVGEGAGVVRSGMWWLMNITGSNTWVVFGGMGLHSASPYYNIGGGSVTLGGALDRVRITTTSGTDTFDAGTAAIMYEY